MIVNLALVLLDDVLRAGTPTPQNLQKAYVQENGFPHVYGISVLFHPGWDMEQLARVGQYPHKMISFAVVSQLQNTLQKVGYELQLTHTPQIHIDLPDHHTLSVLKGGVIQTKLEDIPAQALSAVFLVNTIPNTFR